MQCSQCQHQNNDTAKFCEECGTRFITACPQCGYQASLTAKFCAECGVSLTGKSKGKNSPSTPHILNPNAQPQTAERRQLTVLFCDLVGSTALSAQLDPEDYQAVVQAYQRTCTAVIQRYDGHIAQYLGDGLLVYFGYPAAHEDEARRAVRVGLEIITELRSQVPSPLMRVLFFSPSSLHNLLIPLTLAQRVQNSALLIGAHGILGNQQYCLGTFVTARKHLERGVALYDSQQHHSLAFLFGNDQG
jgi:hypothetical protein